jgi:hypothetical protein
MYKFRVYFKYFLWHNSYCDFSTKKSLNEMLKFIQVDFYKKKIKDKFSNLPASQQATNYQLPITNY